MKALQVSDVSISYNGSLAIDKVSFDVEEGDLLGIVGPNGAGKTTAVAAFAQRLVSRGLRVGLITNPTGWDKFKARVREAVIGFFQRRIARKLQAA